MTSNTHRSILVMVVLLVTIVLQSNGQTDDESQSNGQIDEATQSNVTTDTPTQSSDQADESLQQNQTDGQTDESMQQPKQMSGQAGEASPSNGQANEADIDVLLSELFYTNASTPVDSSRVGGTENPCAEGECVPYYLCANGSVITSGEGILDVRLGADDDPEPEMHPCKEFFDTCCLVRAEEKIIKPIIKQEKCGFRNDNGVAFEIKPRENEAQFAEFPWAVALLHQKDMFDVKVSVYQCGASLIHPSVVLTAAHCVYNKKPNEFTARAGEWDTQRTTEPFPHVDRNVVDFLIHENYRPGSLFNDIALLFLEKPIEMAENINTACLPLADTTYDHERCFANGWGKDKFDKGSYQAILKRVELPVIPRDQCQKRLRSTRLGRFFILDPSFLCAGGERGIDTCTGDGGSPFVCKIAGTQNQYHQVGMVAWGVGCGDETPGVYVNVPKFRNWIDAAFARRELDPKYYIP